MLAVLPQGTHGEEIMNKTQFVEGLMNRDPIPLPTRVVDRTGRRVGRGIGVRLCQLDGCSGRRIITRWPGGKTTHPCTKGMLYHARKNEWRIL